MNNTEKTTLIRVFVSDKERILSKKKALKKTTAEIVRDTLDNQIEEIDRINLVFNDLTNLTKEFHPKDKMLCFIIKQFRDGFLMSIKNRDNRDRLTDTLHNYLINKDKGED